MWNTMLGRLLVVINFTVPNILLTVLAFARVPKEDTALRNQFGKKWDDWAKRVPYAIIPGIF